MRLSVGGARRPRAGRPGVALAVLLVAPGCYIDDTVGLAPPPSDAGGDAGVDAAPQCSTDADCDDGKPCTVDRCAAGMCAHDPAPAGASCEDGNLCNGHETCDASATCVAGTPVVVDDGNPCTADACDPSTGVVTHTLLSGCGAPIAELGAPSPRRLHSAVWTGTAMVVWGGFVAGSPAVTATGGRYDPVADAWTPTATAGAPPPRHSHCAVWTGSRMIVWGGFGASGVEVTGGVYDPAADAWTPTSTTGAPQGRIGSACAWTGSELVIWGGTAGGAALSSGGRYDPAADAWKPLTSAGAPSARFNHSMVWTGSRAVVWGGNDLFNWHADGVPYDPAADAWNGPLANAGAPAAREQQTAVWTGAQMVVWGGFTGGPYLGDGGAYDPAGDAWTALSLGGAPAARAQHAAVWTGAAMIVWGGCGMDTCKQLYGDGGVWTPGAGGGTWTTVAPTAGVDARRGPAAVWTGKAMVAWGGETAKGEIGTGVIYYP